jgi:hypothetical protein
VPIAARPPLTQRSGHDRSILEGVEKELCRERCKNRSGLARGPCIEREGTDERRCCRYTQGEGNPPVALAGYIELANEADGRLRRPQLIDRRWVA